VNAPPEHDPGVLWALVELRGPIEETITAARAFRDEGPAPGAPVRLTRDHLLAAIEARRQGRLDNDQVRQWAQAVRLLDIRYASAHRPHFVLDPDDVQLLTYAVYALAAERHQVYPAILIRRLRQALRTLPTGTGPAGWTRKPHRGSRSAARITHLYTESTTQ